MQPTTEQTFATLELLLDRELPFNLPSHEDGGRISPFIWDRAKQGEFNVLNLCRANGWLKLTDVDVTIKDWQQMNYIKSFPDFSLDAEQIANRTNRIESLFQVLDTSLHNLESYVLKPRYYYVVHPGVVIGRTEDKDWICVSPTVYTASYIPQEQVSRSPLVNSKSDRPLGEKTLNLISTIQAISSEIGTIYLQGDYAGEYSYSHNHQIVSAAAATQELALEQALKASGMLQIGQFNGFLSDIEYIQNWYFDYDTNEIYQSYQNINQFLNQTFSQVIMYRLSFWNHENIYIIGQTSGGDWAGIYIDSQFVYNP